MEGTIPTPPASSTVGSSSLSYQAPPAFRLLEISLISAQDLFPVSKSMRTYAVTWVHSNRKLSTRVDNQGQTNPTWNDKFAFRVDDEFLSSEDAALKVEIYTVSWFRDVLVGTVHVMMSKLLTPQQYQSESKRYVALQIRRPSGSPQGILNMGVGLVDGSMRSMPLSGVILEKKVNDLNLQEKTENFIEGDPEKQQMNSKIHLWRSLSLGSDVTNDEFPLKAGSVYNGSLVNGGSVCNGSIVYGSEICSDVGPSASVVAAEIAMKHCPPPVAPPTPQPNVSRPEEEDNGSESIILEELTAEEAAAKGLTGNVTRWKKEVGSKREEDGSENPQSRKEKSRRHSDGGLFSCFGNAYGFQVTIVCGADKNNSPKPGKSKSKKKTSSSEANSV